MSGKIVSIGGASAFWGDSALYVENLILTADLDYLVFDYLAEITMSLLARAKARDPAAGYAPDFIAALTPFLGTIKERGIRIVSNAGGVNPLACRDSLLRAAGAAGVDLRVAVVLGDDVLPLAQELRRDGVHDLSDGRALPARLMSANAYLGATPIARALDTGADVVITGRCVDSAVTLGPLIHEFGWSETDYDLLSAGSLAGHLIECGPQATGGLFTDWEDVPGWDNMGSPIVTFTSNGSFTVTKPKGTGGLVSPATIAEQLVYEIGDPAAYVLPDVVCDWTSVRLHQSGKDEVTVTGARGRVPTPTYKVAATYPDGYRTIATMMIGGIDADRKARRVADALIERTRTQLRRRNIPDYRAVDVEILGTEATYGPHARIKAPREVILKLAVHHDDKDAIDLLAREFLPSASSMAQGITGFAGGRPGVSPVVRLFSFLIEKERLSPTVIDADGNEHPVKVASRNCTPLTVSMRIGAPTPASSGAATKTVPLIQLAHGRSGDKGNTANIGIIARDPAHMPLLRQALTEEAVAAYFSHILTGAVQRFELPGINALNFLLHGALGGGGMASLRYDPQGKALAQMMLDMPIAVPSTFGGLP